MLTGLGALAADLASAGASPATLFLSFLAFSFAGWLYESTVCALANYGHFANSGFLLGPYCPIYGAGALACWLLLRGVPDIAVQFVAAALVCSVIEYAVGALLERLTGARFWDYSKFPLNIQGRVCLYGAVLFGMGAVFICRVAEPALLKALEPVPGPVLASAVILSALILAIDSVFTLASWRQLSQKLELLRTELADKVNESLKDASASLIDRMPDAAVGSAASLKELGSELNSRLADMSDSALEAMRGKFEIPSFIADGKRGLRLVARHARGVTLHADIPTPEKLKTMLTRRELRFFNAFPEIKLKAYEGVIRATDLKRRARELFYKK